MTPTWPWLSFHMAGLTKTNEVAPLVRFLCRRKLPKWADVIDRQALAHVLAAMGADPVLLRNNSGSDLSPSSAAVGFDATYPIWRVWAGYVRSPESGLTLERAEFSRVTTANAPRLFFECLAALTAFKGKRRHIHRVGRAPHYRRPGVLLRVPADAVHSGNVVVAKARFGAKSPSPARHLRGAHVEQLSAYFACLFNHVSTVPRLGAARTTNLNPAYAAIAHERINGEAPLFAAVAPEGKR